MNIDKITPFSSSLTQWKQLQAYPIQKKKKNNDCRNIYGSSNIPRELVQSLEAADHVMLS